SRRPEVSSMAELASTTRAADPSRIGRSAAIAVALLFCATTPGASAAVTFRVDPASSQATIHVGKAGAFSFLAGHTHEVRGPVQGGEVDVERDDPARSRVRLVFEAAALAVLPAGEPQGDAPKVQDAMESDKVLDVAHHPRITYESTTVALKERRGNALD